MSRLRDIPSEYRDYLAKRIRPTLGQEGATLRWRGFWVGSFLSVFLAVGAPYGNMVVHSTYMSSDFSTPGAIFLFLALIGVFNLVWKLTGRHPIAAAAFAAAMTSAWLYAHWPFDNLQLHNPGLIFSTPLVISSLANAVLSARRQSLALNRAELILVYAMLMTVSALCTFGLSEQLPGTISAIFYYATPQNEWAEKLIPHLPRRSTVNDGADNTLFYEGAASPDIPYGAWVEPLLWWGVFLLALYVAMVSIAVILRRQWMERERLAYPAAQVGLAMIRGEDSERLVNGFFKRPSMWIGWSIPVIISGMRGMSRFGVNLPGVPQTWHVAPFDFLPLQLSIDFVTLGFSYLIHTQIAIGICFFHLLAKLEKAAFVIAGIKSSQQTYIGASDFPFLGYQGAGALVAMALVGLWLGRDHLKTVLLKALGRAPGVDDGDEIMSYRGAVGGTVGGVAVMAWWLWIMGTPLWISLLFVILVLLVFIGLTRIVVEAGVVLLRPPLVTPDLVVQGIGSAFVGPAGVVNMSLTYIWASDTMIFIMGTSAHALKLIEEMDRRSRRLILRALILAMLIGSLGSMWVIFHLAYDYGGINMNSYFFKDGPAYAYKFAMRNIEPAGTYWPGLAFFTGGGALMTLMMIARARLSWWPLHPIGFPIGANYLTGRIWFSVLLAWAVKVLVLRYGGAAFYRSSQSFFLGLIAGQVSEKGIWLVIDYFRGSVGNIVG